MKVIAVLFGGCSTEYMVSLQSAHSLITHMDKDRFTPVLIGLEHESGQWYLYRGNVEDIPKDNWLSDEMCVPVFPATDKRVKGMYYMEENRLQILKVDAALPVLHGKNGEDGTVQGVLELCGIPVIGCNILSSALCMDKEMAHRAVEAAGVKVPKSALLTEGTPAYEIQKAAGNLLYPLFVKPVRAGSSFGITRVNSKEELLPAVMLAFQHDERVIMEEMIQGFEVGCALLGTKELTIGAVDEIELSEGFFDYTEKYTLKTSNIHVPARISPKMAEKVKNTAVLIYRALSCSCFARVDMFVTPAGEIYFNEVNTIPGFTSHSRYPSMLKAAGLTMEEIIEQLLEMEV